MANARRLLLPALAILLLVPAGGCGVVTGILFGTSAIEVCNDAAVGDIVDSIDLISYGCGPSTGEEDSTGICDDSTDHDLWPGDCTTFGGLEPGLWTVRITWVGGHREIFDFYVDLFSTYELSLTYVE